MPLQYKKVRYRFKKVGPKKRVRLAFVGKKKVVEVASYKKTNHKWVKKHTRRIPKKK